jgi:hypothetical protein
VASCESLPKVVVSTSRYLHPCHQNIHAIGDYANGVVLDAFEAALRDVNVTALRPRLEHAQILKEQDIIRVGRLGGTSALSRLDQSTVLKVFCVTVIASVQPTHAYVTSCLPHSLCHVLTHLLCSVSDMWFAEDRLVCIRRQWVLIVFIDCIHHRDLSE